LIIFFYVDAEELNVVLSSSRQAQVDEDDDNNDINVEDYDGADDEPIKEEEDINYNVIFIDKILHNEVFIIIIIIIIIVLCVQLLI
jgi:hypothetical protein